MKEYYTGIEEILHADLTRNEIEKYEFNNETLTQLIEYSKNYQPELNKISQPAKLSCFASFPELVNFNFNTYSGDGSLGDHWQDDNIMAHLLLFNDHVLMYDHLEHYAKSPLSGYTVGHRYDGLKNWLTRLAEWRSFILEDELCIVPKNLAYSPAVKDIWNEGLGDVSKSILCEFDQTARQEIENGYINDCLFEINKITYLIASCSIYKDKFQHLIPFLNTPEQMEYFLSVLKSFFKISSNNYRRAHEPGEERKPDDFFSGIVKLSSPLNRGLLKSKNLIRQLRYSNEITKIRSGINLISSRIASSGLATNNIKSLRKFLSENERSWNEYHIFSNKNPLHVFFNYSAILLPGISQEADICEHQVFKTIFDVFNNTRHHKAVDDLLLNYSLGIF